MKILKDNWFSDFFYNLGLFKTEVENIRFESRYESTMEVMTFLNWLKTPEGLKATKEAGSTGIVIDMTNKPTGNNIEK